MKEVILVGLLTSLLVTIALYVMTIQHLEQNSSSVTIHQNQNPSSYHHPQQPQQHQLPQQNHLQQPHQLLRGGRVSEENINKNRGYFVCLDGSSLTAIANDEYCDCKDGSDEHATSACSNLLYHQRLFKCKSGDLKIFPSRINDGICDCPDGSDEYGNNLECRKHLEISKLYSAF